MLQLPDTLVCGAGGTLGEAWMRGLLNGAADGAGIDFRGCRHFLGTSAGAIVAAVLAAGRAPDAGGDAAGAWNDAAADGAQLREPRLGAAGRAAGRLGAAAAAPVAPLALAATARGGAALRAAALRAVPARERRLDRLGHMLDRLGARFDGRLLIAAVDRRSGRRVLFGAPDAPEAAVRDAVLASCAVPGLFAPVRIGGREYVDGGVWSPTNLDAAPAGRGERVLCLVPTAGGGLLRAPTAALWTTESLALRARGATVETIRPDAASARAMGLNLMDGSRSAAVLAAGYAQGRRAATGG